MAEPAVAKSEDDLGAVLPPPRQPSASTTPDRPCRLSRAAKPCLEEPDAGNPHVRIRGGPGWVTGRVYPMAWEAAAVTINSSPDTEMRLPIKSLKCLSCDVTSSLTPTPCQKFLTNKS